MGDFVGKIKDWWANAEGTQKMFAIGGAAVFAVLLVCVFLFAGRPHMALLFSGLPANEQGNVVSELEKNGIKSEANERGDVMVAADRLAEARMKLAVANKLPASGGFTDFDKEISGIGLMNTPPVEKERLKGILEQRIAESIQSIEGISAARVHIVLAEDKAFISEAKPATASITLTQAPNSMITKEQGKAIATLTANSVPGLTMDNVAVLNNRMEMLYDGHDLNSATGSSNERYATEDMESRKYADNLQRHLDQVYGPGAALVSVHMELDFNQVQSTTDQSTPTDPVAVEKSTEKMDGKKPVVGGPSGAIANAPPAGGAPGSNTGATADNSYTNSHTTFQPGATNTHVSKVEAPGTVKAMGINVIANSDKITDAGPLTDIIDGELGPKASDPNFTRKVTLVKFDTTAAKAEAAAVATAAGNARVQQLISMVPMIALIGVGFFVLRQVIKITRPQPTPVESLELATLPAGSAEANEALDVAGMEITAEALMEANGGVLPEGVKVNPQTGLVVLDGTESLSEEDRMRIVKGISAKVNVPLEQIRRMCQDRPEAVAMLIKGWLLEEKRA